MRVHHRPTAARGLERAGAQGLILATNTMHKVADELQWATDIPLLHIADATAARVRADGLHNVALLATAFTMEQDFYIRRLRDRYREVMDHLVQRGAEGVILAAPKSGCSSNRETPPAAVDTTAIHAAQAVDWMLAP